MTDVAPQTGTPDSLTVNDLLSKIVIKGAREHNLKNIDLELPRNALVVFTGVSGSGKSSLAFDTLYAEGQRRYVESLSAYARQFLGQMEKPKVDYIGGLSPAISIEQKSASRNPRSTVGTVSEIYDYLRVLFARVGEQHCYKCGQKVGRQTPQQMVDHVLGLPERTKFLVMAPMVRNRKGEHEEIIKLAQRTGFARVRVNGKVIDLAEETVSLDKKRKHDIEIVVDRLILKDGIRRRLTDSIETALRTSDGQVLIQVIDGESYLFSERNACVPCGISYDDLAPQNFSFNSPIGMCPTCDGLGVRQEVDPELIVPNDRLTINQGAVLFWGNLSQKTSWTKKFVEQMAKGYGFDLNTPWREMPEEDRDLILFGTKRTTRIKHSSDSGTRRFNRKFPGVVAEIQRLFTQTTSDSQREWYQKFMSSQPCPACEGAKLRPESLAVRVGGKGIRDVVLLSVQDCVAFFEGIELSAERKAIASEVLKEVILRLNFLNDVGLYYLNLDRSAPTLSGGEAQRIRLASQIGSGLVGVLYILDEPSIGLHQRDNEKLLNSLLRLRNLGNTVVVVEHDEATMLAADRLVDFGPGAGKHGGNIIAYGSPQEVCATPESLTGKFLTGEKTVFRREERREPSGVSIRIEGARQNNLKGVSVEIPRGLFTCVTGVSGSGKSTLINQILLPTLMKHFYHSQVIPGKHDHVNGIEYFDKVIDIDQSPIGRTPRSNPATYTKVFDQIRTVFASLPEAKMRGYSAGRFSFNVKGGRCEACQGDGVKKIEMHFLPDVYVQCEVCRGKRFNRETLEIFFKGHTISDILDMDVDQAQDVFENIPAINRILSTLQDVGLGYIRLGQAATTLSGGEAQRIKLARELRKRSTGKTIYILDEPTTGLHFHDIDLLLQVLHRLVDEGNTVVVIEHNLDVIRTADWIIDLGPEGGSGGGDVVGTGTPEQIAQIPDSHTGRFLREILESKP